MSTPPPLPRFGIVIVNYKTPDLVIDAIRSFADQLIPHHDKVVVVDNASDDCSVKKIRQAIVKLSHPEMVQIVESVENRGFSAGNNLGIQAIDADAYWLTNSDTLFMPGSVDRMRQAFIDHAEAGLISPQLTWPDGQPQISCFRFHTPLSEFVDAAATGPITKLFSNVNVPMPVQQTPFFPDWTSFASVIVRQEVIMDVGCLDDRFFMYYEDVDYCQRTWQKGWMVLHVPDAQVIHLRGGSGQVKALTAARKRRPTYYYESRNRYFAKHYSTPGLWLANLMWLTGRGIAGVREFVGNKSPHTCQNEGRDIWTNWLHPLER